MIWDQGTWTPESPDVDAALRKGDLKLTLDGKKLQGSWVLVRTGRRPGQTRLAWLLIKHRDRWATTDDVTELAPRSVVTNRLLVEIARDEGGDMARAATGDPPAVIKQLLANPKLLSPPRKGRKKAVWHSSLGDVLGAPMALHSRPEPFRELLPADAPVGEAQEEGTSIAACPKLGVLLEHDRRRRLEVCVWFAAVVGDQRPRELQSSTRIAMPRHAGSPLT